MRSFLLQKLNDPIENQYMVSSHLQKQTRDLDDF